jgi:hypothetical protein
MANIHIKEAINATIEALSNGVVDAWVRMALIGEGFDLKHVNLIMRWSKKKMKKVEAPDFRDTEVTQFYTFAELA